MHAFMRMGLRAWRVPAAAAVATATASAFAPRRPARCAATKVEVDPEVSHPVFAVDAKWLDGYVDRILAERELNVAVVPDIVEKRIYKMVIRLFLDAIYGQLDAADGTELFGHELDVALEKIMEKGADEMVLGSSISSEIDGRPIKHLVEVIMANSSINQEWLPDSVEEQLYFNCLMLLFRLLERVASTTRIDICGHQLTFKFEPKDDDDLFDDTRRALVQQLVEGKSQVSDSQVQTTIRKCMRQNDVDDAYIPTSPLDIISRSFEMDLYAKLYTMMLGLMKDVLDKSELRILDDRITASIVPKRGTVYKELKKKKQRAGMMSVSENEKAKGAALFMGMVFGLMMVFFAQGHT